VEAPPLGDEHIVLRPPHQGDVNALVAACSDPDIVRFTQVPSPYGVDDARAFLAGAAQGLEDETHFSLVIADAATDELLGTIRLGLQGSGVAEVGYWVRKEARRRGHAARATRLLAEWGIRSLQLARVQLHAFPDNVASQRVAEKAGFTREGLLRSYREVRGERRDLIAFSLVATDVDV
jgi:RimJ/RimL family protein N-acetyltransferase